MIEINKFVRNEEVLSNRGGFAGGFTNFHDSEAAAHSSVFELSEADAA